MRLLVLLWKLLLLGAVRRIDEVAEVLAANESAKDVSAQARLQQARLRLEDPALARLPDGTSCKIMCRNESEDCFLEAKCTAQRKRFWQTNTESTCAAASEVIVAANHSAIKIPDMPSIELPSLFAESIRLMRHPEQATRPSLLDYDACYSQGLRKARSRAIVQLLQYVQAIWKLVPGLGWVPQKGFATLFMMKRGVYKCEDKLRKQKSAMREREFMAYMLTSQYRDKLEECTASHVKEVMGCSLGDVIQKAAKIIMHEATTLLASFTKAPFLIRDLMTALSITRILYDYERTVATKTCMKFQGEDLTSSIVDIISGLKDLETTNGAAIDQQTSIETGYDNVELATSRYEELVRAGSAVEFPEFLYVKEFLQEAKPQMQLLMSLVQNTSNTGTRVIDSLERLVQDREQMTASLISSLKEDAEKYKIKKKMLTANRVRVQAMPFGTLVRRAKDIKTKLAQQVKKDPADSAADVQKPRNRSSAAGGRPAGGRGKRVQRPRGSNSRTSTTTLMDSGLNPKDVHELDVHDSVLSSEKDEEASASRLEHLVQADTAQEEKDDWEQTDAAPGDEGITVIQPIDPATITFTTPDGFLDFVSPLLAQINALQTLNGEVLNDAGNQIKALQEVMDHAHHLIE